MHKDMTEGVIFPSPATHQVSMANSVDLYSDVLRTEDGR